MVFQGGSLRFLMQEWGFDEKVIGAPRQLDDFFRIIRAADRIGHIGDFLAGDDDQYSGS
jgi:hypothetical protein